PRLPRGVEGVGLVGTGGGRTGPAVPRRRPDLPLCQPPQDRRRRMVSAAPRRGHHRPDADLAARQPRPLRKDASPRNPAHRYRPQPRGQAAAPHEGHGDLPHQRPGKHADRPPPLAETFRRAARNERHPLGRHGRYPAGLRRRPHHDGVAQPLFCPHLPPLRVHADAQHPESARRGATAGLHLRHHEHLVLPVAADGETLAALADAALAGEAVHAPQPQRQRRVGLFPHSQRPRHRDRDAGRGLTRHKSRPACGRGEDGQICRPPATGGQRGAMRDGYAEVEGGRLWHRVDGSGPRVLFIPGYTLDLTMWDLQVEALRDRFTCIRFDPRGAGRSPPPTGPYTYIADVEALLSHLGIERAHLVGFSLGAAIALDFTLAHPKKVRSLTLIDASAVGGYPWPDRLKPAFAEISRLAAAGDIAAAKRAWLGHPWFASALERPDS